MPVRSLKFSSGSLVLLSVIVTLTTLIQPGVAQTSVEAHKNLPADASPAGRASRSEEKYEVKLKVLQPAELEKLFNTRVGGGIGPTFGAFSNMFFVGSKIETGTCIGLIAQSDAIAEADLQPAFPEKYKPTLRELFDVLAAQSGTRWMYDAKRQMMKSDTLSDKDADGIVNINFLPIETRSLGFEMTPAPGWKMQEHAGFLAFVPPTAPMGMDFHALGKITSDDKTKDAALRESAPLEMALEALRRVEPDAVAADLKRAKVGSYDAYFSEHQLPPKGEEKIRWRQWHFMVGNQLYHVISTIFKEQDSTLYPDVQAMIKTFRKKEN